MSLRDDYGTNNLFISSEALKDIRSWSVTFDQLKESLTYSIDDRFNEAILAARYLLLHDRRPKFLHLLISELYSVQVWDTGLLSKFKDGLKTNDFYGSGLYCYKIGAEHMVRYEPLNDVEKELREVLLGQFEDTAKNQTKFRYTN